MSSPTRSKNAGLRPWQALAMDAMERWHGGPFLISAAPGAGKTRPAIEVAKRLLEAGKATRIVLVCPTTPLTRQWAMAAGARGLHLMPDSEGPRPPKDFDGVAVTYARIGSNPEAWAKACTPGTLVIADEAHHLGEELAWGDGFSKAFKAAGRWLLLSGTPFRSDATPIPGVMYDRDGVCVPNVSYSYADAVRDGVCRPVSFITYDGTLSWRSGDDVIEAGFDTILTGREAGRRYRTAISTELPDGLPRILREAHTKLQAVRDDGHREAGGLVIAADGTHARRVAKLLHEVTGKAPTVVLHTETAAAKKLQAFTASRDEWIVAVNMVSEGVDIPRLRVGVYATAAKTPLIFRQIVGRFVRTIPGRPQELSWLYLPADPILREHAANVETELRHVLKLRTADEEGEWDEAEERERKEPDDPEAPLEFVPLAADVAPQMALFGPPPGSAGGPAAPKVISPRSFPSAVEDPAPPPAARDRTGLTAFERRALLRDKRHGLVSELRRRDGRAQREINAWLNREVGISKVADATIEQLEKSCALLLDELTGARR
ncbi:MAG: ATP-dependent helicase [Solirubrobacterales bacterium]|nr:ATP-dependent helicase [Solirubrobacterales bacterium]